MQFYQDPEWFKAPLVAAHMAVERDWRNAQFPPDGAHDRVAAAQKAKHELETFKRALYQHIRDGTLTGLPRVRHRAAPPNCHHLTVGEWKGFFILSPDPRVPAAAAILFSRAPHQDVKNRLLKAIA